MIEVATGGDKEERGTHRGYGLNRDGELAYLRSKRDKLYLEDNLNQTEIDIITEKIREILNERW